jgi:hypothetical protein
MAKSKKLPPWMQKKGAEPMMEEEDMPMKKGGKPKPKGNRPQGKGKPGRKPGCK